MPLVLSDPAALVSAAGGHPFVRSALRFCAGDAHGWSSGDALVWAARDERSDSVSWSVMGFGEPTRVADLLGQVAHLLPEHCDISVPRPAAPLLGRAVRQASRTDWDFRWTAHRPPRGPVDDAVRVLEPEEYPEVSALLERANPTASALPEHPWVRQWVGIRDDTGLLVAVAADTSHHDIGHISSVATDPDARGRGFGAAVTAYLTRLHVEEFGVASLGFYVDNAPARRLYDRLGFEYEVQMTSGPRATITATAAPGEHGGMGA